MLHLQYRHSVPLNIASLRLSEIPQMYSLPLSSNSVASSLLLKHHRCHHFLKHRHRSQMLPISLPHGQQPFFFISFRIVASLNNGGQVYYPFSSKWFHQSFFLLRLCTLTYSPFAEIRFCLPFNTEISCLSNLLIFWVIVSIHSSYLDFQNTLCDHNFTKSLCSRYTTAPSRWRCKTSERLNVQCKADQNSQNTSLCPHKSPNFYSFTVIFVIQFSILASLHSQKYTFKYNIITFIMYNIHIMSFFPCVSVVTLFALLVMSFTVII